MTLLNVKRGVAAVACVLAWGCTDGDPADSSSGGGGGSSGSAASSTSRASSINGASTSTAGGSSAAGGSSTATSNISPSSSAAGSSAGTCPAPPFTVCDGVAAESTTRTLVTAQGGALGIDGLVTVGMTRAQVRANITDEERFLLNQGAAAVPLRPFYCEKRLAIAYADTAVDGRVDGLLSDDDVVVGISTLEGFAGSTDTGIAHGDPVSEVTAAYTSGRVQVNGHILGGPADSFAARGLFFANNGTTVTSLGVHRPTNAPLNPVMNIAGLQVGTGDTEIKAKLVGGTTLGTVKARWGDPEVYGLATLDGNDLGYMSYANLGLRLGGVVFGDMGIDAVTTNQIYLTPPFSGYDGANTLGLGATKADFDFAYGAATPTAFENNTTGYVYTVGEANFGPDPQILVVYAPDTSCVDRAQVLVLNWTTL